MPPPQEETLQAPAASKALVGFFVSGMLMAFLGAILPAWGYHLKTEFSTVGHYFLSVNVGLAASIRIASFLAPRKGIAFLLVLACGLGCGALLYLALVSPPAPAWWRLPGLMLVGASAGLLNTGVFHSITTLYRHDPAATVNLSGIFFGLGCFATAILVAGTFYVYTVPSILFWLAMIPGFFAAKYAGSRFSFVVVGREPSWRQMVNDFRSPGAVLFSLLLFFQFGNEWSIAGWLSIFLIQRLGVSPETSLLMLALYWLALMVGRGAAQAILPHFSHGRLLMGSVLSALLGCVILISTNNLFGAIAAILLVGGGFAMVYPLVVERIGSQFPYYHPGFYNGIFSLAVTGGLMAPWLLGYVADMWGIQAVMVLPLAGTGMVFLLVLLILLEAKLSSPKLPA